MARRANAASEFSTRLLNLACLDPGHDAFVHLPGLLALPALEYAEIPGGDPLNDALRRCSRLGRADYVVQLLREDQDFLDLAVVANFGNFCQLAGSPDAYADVDFRCFSAEHYWQTTIGPLETTRLAADWEGNGALGRDHTVWAVDALAKRYHACDADLASANALLHYAPALKHWLYERLDQSALMSGPAWAEPWLHVVAPDSDLVETAPRFASLFALAARASAAGLLNWDALMRWLGSKAGQSRTEDGIAALVGLAPELFGHQLLFWELLVRTRPH